MKTDWLAMNICTCTCQTVHQELCCHIEWVDAGMSTRGSGMFNVRNQKAMSNVRRNKESSSHQKCVLEDMWSAELLRSVCSLHCLFRNIGSSTGFICSCHGDHWLHRSDSPRWLHSGVG